MHSAPMSSSLVVKSNQLINARYSLTVAEIRLFLMMVAQVEKDDHDFKPYRIRIQDYAKAVGTQSKSHYKEIKDAAQNLISRIADIPKEDGGWLKVAFLSSAEYFRGEGVLELCFDPKLKPYLLELKSRFTAYDIRNVLALQSSYSIRIYELLKQFEKIGERTFRLDDLKAILGLEPTQYKRYNDFKRFVIQQAYQDLRAQTDISFEYEELKEGRRIVSIRFIIQRQTRVFGDVQLAPDQGLVQSLKDMGLSQKQAEKYVKSRTRSQILQAITYTQQQYRGGKIKSSVSGYLKKVLDAATLEPTAFEQAETERAVKAAEKKARTEKAQNDRTAQLEAWREEWKAVRLAELEQMVEKADEGQWAAFETWASDHPFLKSRVVVNGRLNRKDPELREWMMSFLEQRLPNEQKAFQDWIMQHKRA
ncbi:MAG: replication initiation protein [Bacteroidota bacterium]